MAGNELSFSHLVLQASLVVQVVMGILVVASLISWSVIIGKRGALGRAKRDAVKFEERFWSGGQLGELYDQVRRNDQDKGLPGIFSAGYEEYSRQRSSKSAAPDDIIAAVQRQMRVAHAREVERMEGGLAMLASIGSTSPYIGLFGTVWGIMHAFVTIGNVKQVTLAMVAPPIAEALIATAIGLFAAIPAVIGYNFLTRAVDSLDVRFSTFADEMVGIVERGLRARQA